MGRDIPAMGTDQTFIPVCDTCEAYAASETVCSSDMCQESISEASVRFTPGTRGTSR